MRSVCAGVLGRSNDFDCRKVREHPGRPYEVNFENSREIVSRKRP